MLYLDYQLDQSLCRDAAINPNKTNNLFFISDNEGNTYFFATSAEHAKKKEELIRTGKWKR